MNSFFNFICKYRYLNEIKFNSVDRVGYKRNNLYERMKPTTVVNGGLENESKKVIDSTRVSADQFVRELLKNNIDETIMSAQPMGMFPNDGGGLDILVGADGSATIVSKRQGQPSSCHRKPSSGTINGRTKNTNSNSIYGKDSSSTRSSKPVLLSSDKT